MLKIELYDGKKTFTFPTGKIAEPADIEEMFPAILKFPHLLEINGNTLQAVQELAGMRQFHQIDDALTDEEAIAAIQEKVNAPQPEPSPSAEDRIAASLEYTNMLNTPV